MKRAALFIGVNRYEDKSINKLEYAESDAMELYGFFKHRCLYDEALSLLNPSAVELLSAVDAMAGKLGSGDLLLLYFAGHGVRFAGQEVLLLPKARYDELEYYQDAIPLGLLKKKTRIEGLNRAIVLDTCRTELLSGQRGTGSGTMRDIKPIKEAVTPEKGDGGIAILCSCDEGQQSREVSDCRQGLFSMSFIESIKESMDSEGSVYLTEELSKAIAKRMDKIGERYKISARQRPWIQISGELPAMIEAERREKAPTIIAPPPQVAHEHRIERVSEPMQKEQSKDLTLIIPGSQVELKMRLIPAGSFMMGSPSWEKDRRKHEGPQHQVTISKAFYMGTYEVTQAQWKAVMGTRPSNFGYSADYPVENVSWNDCQRFIQKLNTMGIGTFRLPTEAEWEYACKAGSTTSFPWGDDDNLLRKFAWYAGNANSCPHPVGQKEPNEWGLYDMHGNVWEWCSDWYSESYTAGAQTDPKGAGSGVYHVDRGGSLADDSQFCRSSNRNYGAPSDSGSNVGFRLVRNLL